MHFRVGVIAALLLSSATVCHAQTEPPRTSIEGTLGYAAFLDEDAIEHFAG